MYIRMYPMCKCYKITPKAFIYQKTKNAPLSEDDNEWKKKKFVAQRTRFFNTRWIYENVDLFGTGAGVYIKTKYHEKTKKKIGKQKSDRIFIHREKCYDNAHTWIPYWLPIGTASRHEFEEKWFFMFGYSFFCPLYIAVGYEHQYKLLCTYIRGNKIIKENSCFYGCYKKNICTTKSFSYKRFV